MRLRTPLRRTTAALVALILVAALASCGDDDGDTPAQPEPGSTQPEEPGLRTVVLGDSFISGGGAGDYDDDAPLCFRSERSWPRQLAHLLAEAADGQAADERAAGEQAADEQAADEQAADDPTTSDSPTDPLRISIVEDRSCGGATIDQLLGPWPDRDQPAQIPDEPDPDVDLVLLGIGGNDVMLPGFALVCATGDCRLDQATPEARATAEARFEAVGSRLVTEVHPAIRAAYPRARIVQVGYVRGIVPPDEDPVDCPWLEPAEQASLAAAAEALDDVLQQAVALAAQATPRPGDTATTDATTSATSTATTAAPAVPPVVFLDVGDALAGHELCTEDPWVHPLRATEAGHPTEEGHAAVAEAAAERLPAALA